MKEKKRNYMRKLRLKKTKCDQMKKLIDLENSKLYFWQNKMEYEACEYLEKLYTRASRYIWPRGVRGYTNHLNKIKLRVF